MTVLEKNHEAERFIETLVAIGELAPTSVGLARAILNNSAVAEDTQKKKIYAHVEYTIKKYQNFECKRCFAPVQPEHLQMYFDDGERCYVCVSNDK